MASIAAINTPPIKAATGTAVCCVDSFMAGFVLVGVQCN
jgi:hypothetical protein